MKKLLLSLALALGLLVPIAANAQCVSAGGVNTVPVPGQNCLTESTINTYSATAIGLVPAATATDIACISGSSSRVIRVLAIRISGSTGTAISTPVVITKRVTLNTGGTAATGNALPVPYAVDPTDAAPTATTTAYTANPTITDTTPGFIDAAVASFALTTTTGGAPLQFNWLTHIYNEPPTLRTATQQVCVNLNGATIATGLLAVSLLWTEAAI